MSKHVTSVREVTKVGDDHKQYRALCICGWESSKMKYESEASLYAAGHRRVAKERESV